MCCLTIANDRLVLIGVGSHMGYLYWFGQGWIHISYSEWDPAFASNRILRCYQSGRLLAIDECLIVELSGMGDCPWDSYLSIHPTSDLFTSVILFSIYHPWRALGVLDYLH